MKWANLTWEKLWNFSKLFRNSTNADISEVDLKPGSLERIFLIGAPYAVSCFWSIDVCDARTAMDTAFARALPDCFLEKWISTIECYPDFGLLAYRFCSNSSHVLEVPFFFGGTSKISFCLAIFKEGPSSHQALTLSFAVVSCVPDDFPAPDVWAWTWLAPDMDIKFSWGINANYAQ